MTGAGPEAPGRRTQATEACRTGRRHLGPQHGAAGLAVAAAFQASQLSRSPAVVDASETIEAPRAAGLARPAARLARVGRRLISTAGRGAAGLVGRLAAAAGTAGRAARPAARTPRRGSVDRAAQAGHARRGAVAADLPFRAARRTDAGVSGARHAAAIAGQARIAGVRAASLPGATTRRADVIHAGCARARAGRRERHGPRRSSRGPSDARLDHLGVIATRLAAGTASGAGAVLTGPRAAGAGQSGPAGASRTAGVASPLDAAAAIAAVVLWTARLCVGAAARARRASVAARPTPAVTIRRWRARSRDTAGRHGGSSATGRGRAATTRRHRALAARTGDGQDRQRGEECRDARDREVKRPWRSELHRRCPGSLP